jgi:hypothetical protein
MICRVKPLEWNKVANRNWWTAPTIFGDISVEMDDEVCHWRYCFDEFYDEASHECESIEAGKEEAEKFYLSRLLPALEVQSP